MPSFSRGRNLDKIGMHAQDTSELFFEDARVPATNLLGAPGTGFFQLIDKLPQERLSIAVGAMAGAEAAFGWTLDYAKERQAFGRPIGRFQHNRFVLAEMRTELDLGWTFVDRQIGALNDGTLTAEDAAEAKWWCTEMQVRLTDRAVQMHGGYGYMSEYPIARAWMDGRVQTIYGGTLRHLNPMGFRVPWVPEYRIGTAEPRVRARCLVQCGDSSGKDSLDINSPLVGTVIAIPVTAGQPVVTGTPLVVLESMKMEHPVTAPVDGTVDAIAVGVGDVVGPGDLLAHLTPGAVDLNSGSTEREPVARRDLDAVLDRHARLEDDHRPAAVERRTTKGRRTARTNLADLVDPESFVEFGALAIAAQETRHSTDDLIERTSSDGVITGIGTVNGDLFDVSRATTAVVIYDDTILAGTQGFRGHAKTDRLLRRAIEDRLPLVLYAEGGGGRPGDVDLPVIAGLEVPTFRMMAQMSGRAPTVAVVAGYCFAGNAVFAACADVIIATHDSNLGAGGPAMIEGGGLGTFAPTEIGPIDDQIASGVVDIRARDEADATRLAKKYLSYFQGVLPDWTCADQEALRGIVPEHRTQIYDIRHVVRVLADTESVLELRSEWGPGMLTALARVEGYPIGIVANVGSHMGGAIEAVGATKAARFLTLCDAYDIPVVILADTPGFMVGPESERQALLRHAGRLMVTGANAGMPVGTVVLRKGYGLGAQAMAAGAFKSTAFTVSWPTGEFGMMNLEGAVRHGYRRELDSIDDPDERAARYEELVAREYEKGTALNMATHFEIDAVIDPADTRRWITSMLRTAPSPRWRTGDHRTRVDPV